MADNNQQQQENSQRSQRSQRSQQTDRGQSRGSSAGVRAAAARDWLTRSTKDPVEHALLGTSDFGYAVLHPIKAASRGFVFLMTGLAAASVVYGALHLFFGKPGAVAFKWDSPTTWIASGVDTIRTPMARVLGGAAETVERPKSYDPNSFE